MTTSPMPVGHRDRRTFRQVIRRLLRRPGSHLICTCAGCDMSEPEARRQFGIPVAHPEWFTRALPDRDEEYLAALAEDLWPDEDYMDIIVEDRLRRRDDDGGSAACTT